MTTSRAYSVPRTTISVDPDFQAAIPPLSSEEFALLEENILRDGVRDALVVWEQTGILLDGHNRYAIATKHGLPFSVAVLPFTTRDDAADWMDANQLGRRNLTSDARALLLGRRYNRTKRQGERTDLTSGQNVHKSTAESLASQHGTNERTVRRAGDFADAVDKLVDAVPDIIERVMSGDIPSRQAVVDAAEDLDTAAEKLSKPHVSHNTGNNEWYTPPQFIEAARAVMGGIDCDPASSKVANRTVKATKFYTADDDGRDKEWGERVWMNPPYAQPLISDFCEALAARVQNGQVKQAIVLVNNGTETGWFSDLVSVASAVVFPRSRIRFWDVDGNPGGAPLQGQAIVYVGNNPQKFLAEFLKFGWGLVTP